MDDGEDIRQLERNLVALGHDPDGDIDVDDEWDWATTAAVARFQDARGLTEVGKVAEQPAEEGGEPTIEVTIRLRGKAARGTGLDQAPVDVGFAVDERKGVLTVPVKALLAQDGGGFAIELAGGRRLVPVEPGLSADGLVEIEGNVREGDTVVTAR